MKKITLLFLIVNLFLHVNQLKAQTTDVVTDVFWPIDLQLIGDDLYILEFSGSRVSKIDITDPAPILTTFITGVAGPAGIAIKDNDLYIAEFNTNSIFVVDITAITPMATEVVSGLNGPI